jgi:hypothetical protein
MYFMCATLTSLLFFILYITLCSVVCGHVIYPALQVTACCFLCFSPYYKKVNFFLTL